MSSRRRFLGILMMHPGEFRQLEGVTAIVKTQLDPDKVGLVIGGGSGHEPIFLEFIGKGYPGCGCDGQYLRRPLAGYRPGSHQGGRPGRGVLYVYGNYAGDNLNFDMGAELADHGRHSHRDGARLG